MFFLLSNIPNFDSDIIERHVMRLITEGNLSYQKEISFLSSHFHPKAPDVSCPMPLWRHYAMSQVILASHASMEGGLSARTAAELTARYRQAIFNAVNMDQLNRIYDSMINDFIHSVHACRHPSALSAPIRQCINYIDSHFDQRLTIELIASKAGYSSPYLARKFRKELGLPLTEYILKIRMDHAIRLLRQSQLSIASISEAVGFHSQSHFSRQFHKYTGTAPGVFRITGRLPSQLHTFSAALPQL